MLKKKGQLTIFIVIGLIILLVSIFLFFTGRVSIWENPELRLQEEITEIVNQCIKESGENAAFILGFQGGYINIDPIVLADFRRYIDFGLKIPNWDTQRNIFPTIESMELELERYVEEDALSCININIEPLEVIYDIEVFDLMRVDSRINNENIIINANLPIRYKEKNTESFRTIENYNVNIENLRLGDLYNLALSIYETASRTNLFEELVLDQIYTASDYRESISMPSEGMHFSCGTRVWTIPQLKSNLANLNNNNFKYLYFIGTRPIDDILKANLNEDFNTQDALSYYINNYRYPLIYTQPSFINYGVNVMMPSTEITGITSYLQRYPYRNFEVSPSSGQLVKPINLNLGFNSKIPIPCIQIYGHRYTLDYDLMIKLTDYNINGNNFFFQFPIRVEIYENQPKSRPINLMRTDALTLNQDNYCLDENRKYETIVYTIDKVTQEPLRDVNISYRCINLECDIGKTSVNRDVITFGGTPNALIEEKLPFCINGELIAKKEGYHPTILNIDTYDGVYREDHFLDIWYELELIPLKTYHIDIGSFLGIDEFNNGYRVYNEEDGTFLVSLTNEQYDFEALAIWPNDNEGFFDRLDLLDIEGIQYNVTVILTDKNFDLKGMMVIENWNATPSLGNEIEFTIPIRSEIIDEDYYLEFYEYMEEIIENEYSQIGIRFI